VARTNRRSSHLRQCFRGRLYVLHRDIVPPGSTVDKASVALRLTLRHGTVARPEEIGVLSGAW
jgi:hypothetical protein